FPQNVLVANDLQVVLHVRRSWNESEKAGDERRAAYAVENVAITQDLRERDQIDCLPRVPKIDKNAINRPVRRNVKVFFVNFLDAFRDGFSRRDKHRPQHALLRINTMRRDRKSTRLNSSHQIISYAVFCL